MKETARRTADEHIERMDEDYKYKMRNIKSQIEAFQGRIENNCINE
jgi:hypothetical protein